MNPQGGTELQHSFLDQYADKKLLEQVQITTSVPEKIPLHPSKPNILWQKNSYDQPNIAPWFNQKTNHNKYDWYVFNSNWTYEKFRMMFDLPTEKCHVIKNGCTSFPKRKIYKKGDPIKIIHQNTPWRGLSVLLGAMQLVKNPLIKLDVYSSTEVYGEEFKKHNDSKMVIKGKRRNRSLIDSFFTWGMQVYCSLKLKSKLNDINAQPKLFSREFYKKNFKNPPLDFSLDLYLLLNAEKIRTVDVFFHKRKHGEAKGGGTMKGKWKLIKRTISYINNLSRKQL